jgi:hypothetical protein
MDLAGLDLMLLSAANALPGESNPQKILVVPARLAYSPHRPSLPGTSNHLIANKTSK